MPRIPLLDTWTGALRNGNSPAETTGQSVVVQVDPGRAELRCANLTALIVAEGAEVGWLDGEVLLRWKVEVSAGGLTRIEWDVRCSDSGAVVGPPAQVPEWSEFRAQSPDIRLVRWTEQALTDLAGLRMEIKAVPGEVFFAAGAPWFFTLFGRDSLWAARMALPLGTQIAGGTLRALAAFQGTELVPDRAEEPGKIPHELRSAALQLPDVGSTLPPLYYGTVDATALWICLLHDAWTWGMPDAEVSALLPALEAALAWMRDYGDVDGDGFLEYHDETGHGLVNQGWKDSSDSIQFQDGRIAQGPLALCEVQGYAYEAAMAGAVLLRHFGRPGSAEWERWAALLKERFAEAFWVESTDGDFPAVALDGAKKQVDSLTSNIGHLLGTGILLPGQAEAIVAWLNQPEMDSGVGLRTLSARSGGYWPLSYHGGSVWAHDTAISIWGMHREGLAEEALGLIEGLLRAAEGFHYRMPELHAGEATAGQPVPYPASCHPQSWSAASVVVVLQTLLGLTPDRQTGMRKTPLDGAPQLELNGIKFAGKQYCVSSTSTASDIESYQRP